MKEADITYLPQNLWTFAMICQEERRGSCQKPGKVTNGCTKFRFTINQLPITFRTLYTEKNVGRVAQPV